MKNNKVKIFHKENSQLSTKDFASAANKIGPFHLYGGKDYNSKMFINEYDEKSL